MSLASCVIDSAVPSPFSLRSPVGAGPPTSGWRARQVSITTSPSLTIHERCSPLSPKQQAGAPPASKIYQFVQAGGKGFYCAKEQATNSPLPATKIRALVRRLE